MTVFADTPRWERHGHVWGHLVSDTSLAELHAAADAAGIPPRAFDLDHYDWPAALEPGLATAGVQRVGNGELARLLRASGLRVAAVDRPAARRERTRQAALALGLARVPHDLLVGTRGHTEPMPALPGAFRVTRNAPDQEASIDAHDDSGRAAALAFLAQVDQRSIQTTGAPWVGQAMDVGPLAPLTVTPHSL